MWLVGWADLSDDSADDDSADVHRTARHLGTDDTAAADGSADDAPAGRDPAASATTEQAGCRCAAADPGGVALSSRAAAGAT
ncbi:hypothetical protein [Nocardia sp. NPDC049149]|uniref:hypothetical protein n=1 Tax=Nocardia sp. NPDC049149 TaxID=3364315 RepID=UPI0037201C3D